eukprot:7601729-Ditylum_brightwellii.AAC.1
MDLHADTCCAGANWCVVDFTGEVPLAKCATVFTDKDDGAEMLLMVDQMLWFGTQLPHSLINPNQIRAYGIPINDNPFGD